MNKPQIFAQFPGQGSQKVGMGQPLADSSDLARQLFAKAEAALGFSLYDVCLNGPAEKLTLTEIAQPAILTVSIISFLLTKDKFTTIAAAGHSLGEYTALVAAEAISFEDAVLLVHKRGKYMQQAVAPGAGKMVAVLGEEIENIEKHLSGKAEIANINAPGQIVVSGSKEDVEAFVARLPNARTIDLPVSAPFHSSLMKPAEEKLAVDIKKLSIKPAKFPVYSNFYARGLTDPEEIRDALIKQVCGRVRWVECVQAASKELNFAAAVEFGIGNTLCGLWKRIGASKQSFPLYEPTQTDTIMKKLSPVTATFSEQDLL